MSAREDERDGEAVRRVTTRAIRRLDILEYAILVVAALLAVGGGWLVAILVTETTSLPFVWSWSVAAVVLFAVPGGITWWRSRSSPEGRRETSIRETEGDA